MASPNNNMLVVNGKVYKCVCVELNKDLIKTNFNNTDYQCREVKQESVIESIKADFKGYLIFDNCSVDGLPVVDKSLNVVIGNHRAEALKTMSQEQFKKVQESYKEYFGKDLHFDNIPVRIIVEDINFEELYEASKVSNINRENTFGEKAINNESKYKEELKKLPNFLCAESVDEMEQVVYNRLSGDSSGLNVMDCNLALLTNLLGNDKQTMECFEAMRHKGIVGANKIRDMLISNAGALHNLINDERLSHLNFKELFAGAIRSMSMTHTNRLISDTALLQDLNEYLSLTPECKEVLCEANPKYQTEFVYACIGNALSKFLEQQNPSGVFFEFISTLPDRLVEDYSSNLLNPNASVKDIDMYDVLPYFINNGRVTYIQTDLESGFKKLKEVA